MSFMMRISAALACAAVAAATLALGAASPASAQGFPDKTIRVIVPAPAGGTMDLVARGIAEELKAGLGQTLVIDNKPGGAGMIGVADLLNSPRDGHTVIVHISGIVSEIPHIARPPYDPFKDIKPLVELTRSGLVFVGAPSLPATSFAEVIAHVKANPGKINYASYSAGTMSHTKGIELNAAAGLDMTHVAYRGSPPALQDLLGGHVALMFDGAATSLQLIRHKAIKAFAVTTEKRMAALPDVPTLAELGYPKMTQVGWVGLFIAPDVPEAAQNKLRSETLKALALPSVRERFAKLGFDPPSGGTPEQLAADLKSSHARQGAVLESVNFRPQH